MEDWPPVEGQVALYLAAYIESKERREQESGPDHAVDQPFRPTVGLFNHIFDSLP